MTAPEVAMLRAELHGLRLQVLEMQGQLKLLRWFVLGGAGGLGAVQAILSALTG